MDVLYVRRDVYKAFQSKEHALEWYYGYGQVTLKKETAVLKLAPASYRVGWLGTSLFVGLRR